MQVKSLFADTCTSEKNICHETNIWTLNKKKKQSFDNIGENGHLENGLLDHLGGY